MNGAGQTSEKDIMGGLLYFNKAFRNQRDIELRNCLFNHSISKSDNTLECAIHLKRQTELWLAQMPPIILSCLNIAYVESVKHKYLCLHFQTRRN